MVDDHVADTREQSVEGSTEHVQEVKVASLTAKSLLAQHFVLSATRAASLLPSTSSGKWKERKIRRNQENMFFFWLENFVDQLILFLSFLSLFSFALFSSPSR